MRAGTVFLVTLEIALGLGFSCYSPQREPQLSGPVGIVRFPEPWVKLINDHWVGVNDNTHYVLRKSARGELLFAVKQGFTGELFGKEASEFPVKNPIYDYYSDTRYSVRLDGTFRVRTADLGEWDAGNRVIHSYHFIHTFQNPQLTEEGVQYKDRLYRRTGKSWGNEAALVSPQGTWIAVLSYTSPEKPPKPLLPGFGGTEPVHGEVFLDLYEISSGEKVIGARSPYGERGGGFAPSMLFGGALWAENRYFIMPLDWELDGCLVGILPEK
jgi:hypothetical protein